MASKFPRDRLTGGLRRDPDSGAILVNLDESAVCDLEASDNDVATRGVMRDSEGAVLVKVTGLPSSVASATAVEALDAEKVDKSVVPVHVDDYLATTSSPAAAIDAAIQAATAGGTRGGTVQFHPGGVYDYGTATTPPKVPRNLPGKLVIDMQWATIKTSPTCPRAFDFQRRSADGDVYGNVRITNWIVDAGALTGSYGVHHGLIGTLVSGVGTIDALNVSIKNVEIGPGRGLNGPHNVAGQAFFWICLGPSVASDGPPQTISDVTIDGFPSVIDLQGGDTGIYVGGFGRTSAPATNANLVLDAATLRIANWRHALPSTPSTFFTQNHVIVGHRAAMKGQGYLGKGYGRNCCDVGVEIDCPDNMIVEDVTVEDSLNAGFFSKNMCTPVAGSLNRVTFRRCQAKRTNLVPVTAAPGSIGNSIGHGWWAEPDTAFGVPPEQFLRDCTWTKATTDARYQGTGFGFREAPVVDIDGLKIIETGADLSTEASGLNITPMLFKANSGSPRTVVRMRRLSYLLRATAVTGKEPIFCLAVFSRGTYVIDVDGVDVDFQVVGGSGSNLRGFAVGDPLGVPGTIAQGRFARLVPGAVVGDGQRIVQVGSTSVLTIPTNATIAVEDSDFSRLTAADTSAVFADATQKARVRTRRTTWRQANYLAPAALAPTATSWTYQNLDMIDEDVVVQGGTVTKLEWSPDGGTYYDLGITAGRVRVGAGEWLRSTHSATPTMTKVPLR